MMFEDVAILAHGNMPVILSSHHDGSETRINGVELAVVRQVENDMGINRLACLVADIFYNLYSARPFLLTYKIKKDRSTGEMFAKYVQKILEVSERCFSIWGKCAVLDLHRFYKHPGPAGEIKENYDIWLGTDHRKTVSGEFDKKLAIALKETYKTCFGQTIKIYVPQEEVKEGERFGATGKLQMILTKCLGDAFSGRNFSAVQMEFYKDMVLEGAPVTKLAIALASALGKI